MNSKTEQNRRAERRKKKA